MHLVFACLFERTLTATKETQRRSRPLSLEQESAIGQ